jgi:hypothetical protein
MDEKSVLKEQIDHLDNQIRGEEYRIIACNKRQQKLKLIHQAHLDSLKQLYEQ